MTDMQTLLAQVNDLYARMNVVESRGSTIIGTDVANPQSNFTSTSLTSISLVYSLAGGDATTTTVYRLQAWGDFTIPASSPQVFTWGLAAYGLNSTTGLASCAIGGAYQTGSMASQVMEWGLTCLIAVKVAGSSGTVNSFMWGSIGQFGANLGQAIASGPQSNSLALAGGAGDVSADTTTNLNYALQGKWGGAVTSPQAVRYFGSTLERLGP